LQRISASFDGDLDMDFDPGFLNFDHGVRSILESVAKASLTVTSTVLQTLNFCGNVQKFVTMATGVGSDLV